MLCEACQDIFSRPRKLTYGTYYPWNQTIASFAAALRAGCHLCSLIQESRSYGNLGDDPFPNCVKYAFKALSQDWAQYGKGQKWLVPQTSRGDDGDDEGERARYMRLAETDPTPNGLGQLLATDAEEVVEEAAQFWLVLEFYGPGAQVVLPMEIATGRSRHQPDRTIFRLLTKKGNKFEELAQKDIDGQDSTGCKENLELARAWLSNCLDNHPSCGPRQQERWLPTRLLDVGSCENQAVCLVSGSRLDPESPYAALSHRWGTDKSFVLSSTNLASYQANIPVNELSSTICQAIEVTRGLALQYLWVDSMCIVQDDADDWARESATMSKVYGLSTCTIAAANSSSIRNGCFTRRNQYLVRPCRVPNPFKTDSKYSFHIMSQYLNQIHDREVRRSEWYSRGWVFQERTLSPRLLIFSGNQILWACERLQAAETWPSGKTSENYIDRFESFAVEKARFYKLLGRLNGVSTSHSAWWTFIQDYMSAELTVRSDRLVALQGIATLIESLTGQAYCGGFWLNDNLPHSLLWKPPAHRMPRPMEYRGPSWSWASIDGKVQLNSGPSQGANLIRVLGKVYVYDGASPKSRSPQDGLRVAGLLLPAAALTYWDGFSGHLVTRDAALQWAKLVSIFNDW
jgi:hypothetical protein